MARMGVGHRRVSTDSSAPLETKIAIKEGGVSVFLHGKTISQADLCGFLPVEHASTDYIYPKLKQTIENISSFGKLIPEAGSSTLYHAKAGALRFSRIFQS